MGILRSSMAVRQVAVAVLVLAMLFRCRAQKPACCESGSCVCPYVSRLHSPGNHGYGILTTGKRQWRHGPATVSPNQLLTTSHGEGAPIPGHTDRDDPVISVRVRLHRLAERLHNLREICIVLQTAETNRHAGTQRRPLPSVAVWIGHREAETPEDTTTSFKDLEIVDESFTTVAELWSGSHPGETAAGVNTASRRHGSAVEPMERHGDRATSTGADQQARTTFE
ncbi:Hypp8575 [Branchiostoma lanceolatum]|uniref:Hypocretin neuropeptide precursor n=1 Tax=Branchiostoma lanceolatum TaxID=7740 RepID=A0A8J9Z991_BRALA|nr:Hypp8575 [Branchiostoma lanceolatum]